MAGKDTNLHTGEIHSTFEWFLNLQLVGNTLQKTACNQYNVRMIETRANKIIERWKTKHNLW